MDKIKNEESEYMFLITLSRFSQQYKFYTDFIPFDNVADMTYDQLEKYMVENNQTWCWMYDESNPETSKWAEVWLYIIKNPNVSSEDTIDNIQNKMGKVISRIKCLVPIKFSPNEKSIGEVFLAKITEALGKENKKEGEYTLLTIDGIEVHLTDEEINALKCFLETYSPNGRKQNDGKTKIHVPEVKKTAVSEN